MPSVHGISMNQVPLFVSEVGGCISEDPWLNPLSSAGLQKKNDWDPKKNLFLQMKTE